MQSFCTRLQRTLYFLVYHVHTFSKLAVYVHCYCSFGRSAAILLEKCIRGWYQYKPTTAVTLPSPFPTSILHHRAIHNHPFHPSLSRHMMYAFEATNITTEKGYRMHLKK